MEKPFMKAGYAGIAVILVSIILMAVNPPKAVRLPGGFFTPVVAFEFIKTESEVYDLFGHDDTPARAGLVREMEVGTYVDFFYMAVYSLFLLLVAFTCRRLTGERWFLSGSFIVLFILLSDFGENIQLLAVMSRLSSGGFGAELVRLNYLTWAKWGGLTCLFISLIPFFRRSGGLGRSISLISFLSAIIGAMAFLHRSFLNEVYVLSIAVIFIMVIIFSFTYTVRDGSETVL